MFWRFFYGVVMTFIDTQSAFDTFFVVNDMYLVRGVCNGINRAGFSALGTAGALVGNDIADHLFAYACLAYTIHMFRVFVAKIGEGGQHRVRRRFTQPAKG